MEEPSLVAKRIRALKKKLAKIAALEQKESLNDDQLELFNSKVDHPDYQADSTRWGAALVALVGSDRFRLLYDVYHMQIMEGDVIRTLRDYAPYIAHVHTAGVPGRNEIDETQELCYPAIARTLA